MEPHFPHIPQHRTARVATMIRACQNFISLTVTSAVTTLFQQKDRSRDATSHQPRPQRIQHHIEQQPPDEHMDDSSSGKM